MIVSFCFNPSQLNVILTLSFDLPPCVYVEQILPWSEPVYTSGIIKHLDRAETLEELQDSKLDC